MCIYVFVCVYVYIYKSHAGVLDVCRNDLGRHLEVKLEVPLCVCVCVCKNETGVLDIYCSDYVCNTNHMYVCMYATQNTQALKTLLEGSCNHMYTYMCIFCQVF